MGRLAQSFPHLEKHTREIIDETTHFSVMCFSSNVPCLGARQCAVLYGLAPDDIPEDPYVGEFARYSVVSNGGMNSGDFVSGTFRNGIYITSDGTQAVRLGNGTVIAEFLYAAFQRGQVVASIRVPATGASCDLFATAISLPDASIDSITGLRQFRQVLTFTADLSVDPVRSGNATYNWDFGDGRTGQGRTVQHAYEDVGTFTVELEVSDGRRSDTTTQNISIANDPNLPGKPRNLDATPRQCINSSEVQY